VLQTKEAECSQKVPYLYGNVPELEKNILEPYNCTKELPPEGWVHTGDRAR
jgi:hypothetical protein